AAAWALRAAEAVGEGRVAVICPAGLPERIRTALAAAPAGTPFGTAAAGTAAPSGTADVLAAPIAVLTVAESKGLEFDAVVVAEPQMIINGSRRGLADLYVALTRATRTLTVVHSGPLPTVLRRLATERRPAGGGRLG
ncbi:ATP-binding domain-containing protein, partial [Frankia sp. CiP1_Cm_nod2]|uniref:ATP-binding domain-containing protein n=1 Tax=Frankia sp. CiP1_Cm_nod2 TaxID=2897161 RepID=UPI00202496B6